MEIAQWLVLLGVCTLGAMSPGPSLAVVTSHTLAGGRSHGVAAALAHGSGVALYAALTVLGLTAALTARPGLFLVVQWIGAAYLAYLGCRLLLARAATGEADTDTAPTARSPVREGFLVAFLNPKLAIFMLAVFSQFLSEGAGLAQKAVMVATAGAVDGLWYTLVALGLSHPRLQHRLRRQAALIDRLFGLALLALAVALLWRTA
ncbi:LysE family translocator [Mangrovimicrobium sediminis]|uniref:LysE family translocator n=1 Tax=Mangrovimicrobium sediminis TaxID=2562682 RepID=A0A4Z0M5N7_9GAMM|nr:LysE family translocator [Haliea sp. SAOS-164]TGD74730.1 LysE family translocator [Haliea sp. SAOS-164]